MAERHSDAARGKKRLKDQTKAGRIARKRCGRLISSLANLLRREAHIDKLMALQGV